MKNEAMDLDINETNSQCILGSNLNSAAIICTQNSTLTNQILSNEALENTLLNTSPLSTSSNGNAAEMHSNDSGDAEGVWSPDIDQAFHEALQIYPPCGRRKIILSDEGKMYGRNELIARYIKIRCGKTRTRKQVSSHIQVLARKKQREEQARTKHSNSEINCESIPVNLPLRTNESTNLNSILTDQSSVDELLRRSDTSIESRSQNYPINTQPFINLLTKDQIASMRAQVLKAASAIPAKGATNTNWLCTLTAGNFNQLDTKFSIPTTNSIDIIKNIANRDRVLLSSNISQCETILPSTSTSANNFALASSKLILSGFTAYIEQNLKNAPMEGNRIEIVHIPKTSSAPLEKINLDLIQAKYPPILQELFKKGPTDAFFLSKCWTNMNFDIGDEQNTLFAVDSYYEAIEKFDIVVSSKVCSFGNEVVEKVEIYSPVDDDDSAKLRGIWHFKLEKSPMCEYMVRFISELKKLHEPSLMNSVLENFTVLQIVTDKQTGDTLMVIAFVFEIRDDGEDEIFTNIYRLTES